jgi:hypothetical protein
MMALFLVMILHQEAKLFLAGVWRESTTGLMQHDTDVFPDECIHPFPNFIPPPCAPNSK